MWQSLSAQGIAVLNLDADFVNDYQQQIEQQGNKIITFSISNACANLFASNIRYDAMGNGRFTLNIEYDNEHQMVDIQLNIAGQHNVSNALAAASMAIALGCDIDAIQLGLNALHAVSGRVNCTAINEFISLIDDTYNANSASVKAAIDLLALQEGATLLILGDMAELGQYSEQEHIAVGEYAALKNIEQLLTVGILSEKTSIAYNESTDKNAIHFTNKQALNDYLREHILSNRTKVTILVKGSRGAKMEDAVAFIKQASH
ncbi:Mur ligase family protein [Psychromonas sp. MME1]|uniref:Mur ligase family protein n=1 Tax=Psychromonas sp. MME1 TaxID=3231032 RepID=UPI0034E27DB7